GSWLAGRRTGTRAGGPSPGGPPGRPSYHARPSPRPAPAAAPTVRATPAAFETSGAAAGRPMRLLEAPGTVPIVLRRWSRSRRLRPVAQGFGAQAERLQFAFVEPVAGIPFLGAGDAVGFATQRARFALAELSAVAPAVDRLARFVQFAANPGRADDGLDLADSG